MSAERVNCARHQLDFMLAMLQRPATFRLSSNAAICCCIATFANFALLKSVAEYDSLRPATAA